jgi:hypothetical protein
LRRGVKDTRAGHASPAAVLRYQHAREDHDRVLADALADLASDALGIQTEHATNA